MNIQVKIMSVLRCSRKVVSPVFRNNVLLEQTGVFGGLISRARCYSLCVPQRFTTNLTSCQHWHHVPSHSCYFVSKRCYSERSERTDSERSERTDSETTGVSGEESHGMDDRSSDDSSLSQRPSETFTLDVLVSLLRQENAVDLCVIKVPEHIKYTEYFIVVSSVSPRHLRAMAFYAVKVYKFLKKDGDPNVKIEGKDAEDWMCIDFGNMVVHFMLPETREVYELEKLWTLRNLDEQLKSIPAEKLPEDFVLDVEVTK